MATARTKGRKHASPLAVFKEHPGQRVWRPEVQTHPDWKLTANERTHGPHTDFPDGIYIVTVSENTPANWINDLAWKASIAGRDKHYCGNFLPSDNYDSAIAVYKGRVIGGAWAGASWVTRHRWRVALKADGTGYTQEEFSGESEEEPEDRPSLKADQEMKQFRPTILSIWVSEGYRRLGIGRQIVAAVAEHFGIPTNEIGFRLPVSAEGTHMLLSMGLEEIICGF